MSFLDDLSSSWDSFTNDNLGLSSDQSRALGTGLLGAVAGGALGGGRGALTGAGIGGMLGGGGQQLGNLFGLSGNSGRMAGNALLGGLAGVGAGGGGGFGKGALLGGALSALSPQFSDTLIHGGTGSPLARTAGAVGSGAVAAAPKENVPSGWSTSDLGLGVGGGGGAVPAVSGDSPRGLQGMLGSLTDKKNLPLLLLAMAAAQSQSRPKKAQPTPLPGAFTQHLPQLSFDRQQAPAPTQDSYYTYGSMPEQQFYSRNQTPKFAAGGGVSMPHIPRGGLSSISRKFAGKGSGRADQIDAKVSPGEYVMDSETMALLGDGNPDHGADKMDAMRTALRAHKGKALAKGKISPNAKSPLTYIRKNGAKP